MIKINTIQHYLSMSGIRITVSDVSSAAAKVQELHHLPALTAVIVGKILAGTSVLATDFKNHEGISILWQTNSILGSIHADAYEGYFIRGYVDTADDNLPVTSHNEKLLISDKAQLTVTRYSLVRTPYSSHINLSFGNISECLGQYLKQSDQIKSFIFVTAAVSPEKKITRAAGIFAQLLPEGNKEKFTQYFRNRNHLFSKEGLFQGHELETLIKEGGFSIIKEAPVAFRCTCSEERIKTALVALPKSERVSLLKDEYIEISCHYCGKIRKISRETLQHWFQKEGSITQ